MRPHVEFIHAQDLCWHSAELPLASGRARQQNVSYDEENGAASTRIRFDEDWHRAAGYHAADTEWFVLEGRVELGDRSHGRRLVMGRRRPLSAAVRRRRLVV